MDHIQDVYKKKSEMIEKIWNHLTKVNLKVDGKPFQVVYNEEEDELEYHGRSGNETKVGPLIDDMSRLFSKPINDAIRHIENRVEIFKRYKFLTFEVINEILLLTAIITKDGEFINDPDKIDNIAKELDTDVMPCLWKGKISEEQKEVLMQVISTNIVPTKDEFIKWVKELFGTYDKFPKSLISRSEEFIEGLVFFYDVNGKVVEYKLVDPAYRNLVKDNQNKNKDEEIAKKFERIYNIFVDWSEDNVKTLDKNRIRSIEFNFIEMMKNTKIYNKLMNLGSGLTLSQSDSYFLQLDRVSDELRKEIKKHGNVYQLLFEKFVKLFYKAKKRGFVISKEFQERVNKLVDIFADYTLNEDEIEINGEILLESSQLELDIHEEEIDDESLQQFLDYLESNKENKKIFIPFIKKWKLAQLHDLMSYIESSGLSKNVVESMLSEVSFTTVNTILNIITNNNNEKDTLLFDGINDVEKHNIISFNLFDKIVNLLQQQNDNITKTDVLKLFNNVITNKNSAVGPGENLVALLFNNAKKANKGDIMVDNKLIEFKNGGKLSTVSCNGTIGNILNNLSTKEHNLVDILSTNKATSYNDILKLIPNINDNNAIDNEFKKFFKNVKNNEINIINDFVSKDENKKISFISIIGAASIIYYSLHEEFHYLLVMYKSTSTKKIKIPGLIIKCNNNLSPIAIDDIINNDLFNEIIFGFNKSIAFNSRAGGGLEIKLHIK